MTYNISCTHERCFAIIALSLALHIKNDKNLMTKKFSQNMCVCKITLNLLNMLGMRFAHFPQTVMLLWTHVEYRDVCIRHPHQHSSKCQRSMQCMQVFIIYLWYIYHKYIKFVFYNTEIEKKSLHNSFQQIIPKYNYYNLYVIHQRAAEYKLHQTLLI